MRMQVEDSVLERHSQGTREREEALSACLAEHPVASHADQQALQDREQAQRSERQLIPGESVDPVISNCMLNPVADHEKPRPVGEIFRVLRPGGRVAIADCVCDRAVTPAMKQDPGLRSGCIYGVFCCVPAEPPSGACCAPRPSPRGCRW